MHGMKMLLLLLLLLPSGTDERSFVETEHRIVRTTIGTEISCMHIRQVQALVAELSLDGPLITGKSVKFRMPLGCMFINTSDLATSKATRDRIGYFNSVTDLVRVRYDRPSGITWWMYTFEVIYHHV